jgi:hypothetical protein
LLPMHHSRARGFGVIRPLNMDRMKVSNDQAETLDKICLGIFADMSNAGATLAETLRAVYMTGAQNTLAITQQQRASNDT